MLLRDLINIINNNDETSDDIISYIEAWQTIC